jgi:hypothetical protein
MLKRQGFSESLNGVVSDGVTLNLYYHHGGKYQALNVTTRLDRSGAAPNYSGTHYRLTATLLPDVLKEAAAIIEAKHGAAIEFDPEIEAYMYNGAASRRLWPCIANDVYVTGAVYEVATDTIRHAVTNVCLVVFEGETGAQYPNDSANKKYAVQITEGLRHYHGQGPRVRGAGIEGKAWLAWLIGEYIKDEFGETRRVKTIEQ